MTTTAPHDPRRERQPAPGRMRRPFRGLRDREPDARYDVVVVGAGVGGLVAANLLQRDGLRTLLIEQHYMVGGYCSTFRRAGFTFDASTHFYPLVGNPSTLTGKLLADLGVAVDWIAMDPVDTFHLPDGSRFAVPANFDTYRAALASRFPHQRGALDAFFAQVREAYMLGLLVYFRGRHPERLGALAARTVRDVLDAHFDDPALKLVLTADCPHWGSPPERTSFVFDSMLRLSYFLGNYYPRGGSQAFADALAHTFEQRGGDILTSARVDRIVVRDDRVRGVEIETRRGRLVRRRTVDAGVVVSNADLVSTIDHLLPTERIDPAYRAALGDLRPTYPCFLVHLGLRGADRQALEHAQGYYWRDWDPDRVGRDALRCKIFSPTVYEPRMAPEGGDVVILQKVLDMGFHAVTDWPTHKREITRQCMAQLEAALPGVRDQIVVATSASAQTAVRFTDNRLGAMLGWEMAPDQLGADRPPVVGPVAGLYLTGHWTQPGGGITPVIVSAMEVARAITGRSRAVDPGLLGQWRHGGIAPTITLDRPDPPAPERRPTATVDRARSRTTSTPTPITSRATTTARTPLANGAWPRSEATSNNARPRIGGDPR